MTHSVFDSFPLSGPSPRLRGTAARPSSTLVQGAGLLACLDSLAAVASILSVLVTVNLPTMSVDLESFLSTRITVKNVLLLIFLATAWPLVFYLFGLYRTRWLDRFETEAAGLVGATSIGSLAAFVFPLTSVSGSLSINDIRQFWATSLALCLLVRTVRRFVDPTRQQHVRRTLIVGTGRLARLVQREMRLHGPGSYELVGFVDEPIGEPNDGLKSQEVSGIKYETIGTLEELEEILMRQVIDEVIIALPVKSCYQQIQYAIGVCERAGVQSSYGADLFESTVAYPRYDAQGTRTFVAMQVGPHGWRLAVKRAIDIVGASLGLVLLLPLMLMVALAIKLTSPGPILYVQDRCGLNKRPFPMYKFRSMFADADSIQPSLEARNEANGPIFKIWNDPRITPLGALLRKSSIDELPQLWNVLRGEMSLVGPRPLPRRDVHRFTRASDMRRFSMRPGLTCLWQVHGRSNLDFDRWVELDMEYIDTWSLASDFRILVRTIPAVLSGEGAA